jgi:hypothetical protein
MKEGGECYASGRRRKVIPNTVRCELPHPARTLSYTAGMVALADD